MTPITPTSPKVTAAAGGGGTGIALSIILVWLLTENGITVPEPVATAIGAIITTALASGAAWLKRDRLREVGQIHEDAHPGSE